MRAVQANHQKSSRGCDERSSMTRVDRVRALLAGQHLDAILIHNPENRTYLTGFVGSAGVALVTARGCLLLVDFRYVVQAASDAPGWEVGQVAGRATGIGRGFGLG